MNPRKIRESIEDLYPKKPKKDENDEINNPIAFLIGYFLGILLQILISWIFYGMISDNFGIPALNFLEFFGIWWIWSVFMRVFRK